MRALDAGVDQVDSRLRPEEVGMVRTLSAGIARVEGLPRVQSMELLRLSDNVPGLAFNLEVDEVGVVLLGRPDGIRTGSEVQRTRRVLDVPVGDALIGRVLDPLGRPIDGGGPIAAVERRPVERDAPAIRDRDPVTVPLQTGLQVIDALIPIGRGQRELILGDRQTGKTAIALDTIVNQRDSGVICIYCAIGQRAASVARVIDDLRRRGAMDWSLVVNSAAHEPPGLHFVAPYAATAIGEYFMDQGRDVLVVYDDLTRHARAYREMSLLLERPPGREAFPGDVFYLHSRLLERSTHLAAAKGGGSLTALPIVETEAQNLSAYIPTNVISITDGQIYLSPTLFQAAVLPAVDVGKSVSRVGGKTQLPAYRQVVGDLRLAYTQFEELELFARFATRLDDATHTALEHGRRVREVLKQPRYNALSAGEQVAVLLATSRGLLDPVPIDRVREATRAIRRAVLYTRVDLLARIENGEQIDEAAIESLLGAARHGLTALDGGA
ncbi:MAG: alternate F1F0 ATPase, F1 subunit alpha [Planctomycetota bacterium]